MKENWKDIKGFEGLYQVSDLGNIKSLGNGSSTDSRTKQVRILKLQLKKTGYLQVKLCKEGRSFYKRPHRLVAEAFIYNPENKKEVNHINGIKNDNRVENLEWCTSSENQIHSFKNGLQKIYKGKDHIQSRPIIQLSIEGKLVKEWESIKQVKRELGFNTCGIIKCCKKQPKYKTAYGFKWQYKQW